MGGATAYLHSITGGATGLKPLAWNTSKPKRTRCRKGCPGDSAHADGFCPRAKPEDDPCAICGGTLSSKVAVKHGQCDNCLRGR